MTLGQIIFRENAVEVTSGASADSRSNLLASEASCRSASISIPLFPLQCMDHISLFLAVAIFIAGFIVWAISVFIVQVALRHLSVKMRRIIMTVITQRAPACSPLAIVFWSALCFLEVAC